jgi:hypothetical protein
LAPEKLSGDFLVPDLTSTTRTFRIALCHLPLGYATAEGETKPPSCHPALNFAEIFFQIYFF